MITVFVISWTIAALIGLKSKLSFVMSTGGGFLAALVPAVIYGLIFEPPGGNTDAAVEACVSRGIAYYKEIGSYPTLKSSLMAGRSADAEARERCERSPTAF